MVKNINLKITKIPEVKPPSPEEILNLLETINFEISVYEDLFHVRNKRERKTERRRINSLITDFNSLIGRYTIDYI